MRQCTVNLKDVNAGRRCGSGRNLGNGTRGRDAPGVSLDGESAAYFEPSFPDPPPPSQYPPPLLEPRRSWLPLHPKSHMVRTICVL